MEKSQLAYQPFLGGNREKKIVLFEIGVGHNTLGIIKYPFEKIMSGHCNATLVRVNRDHSQASNNKKTIAFNEDLLKVAR